MVYIFSRSHTLDRVLYAAGDEIERTQRLGDWLISQGVPLRRKSAPSDVVPVLLQPATSSMRLPQATGVLERINAAPVSPRWCCGGLRKK